MHLQSTVLRTESNFCKVKIYLLFSCHEAGELSNYIVMKQSTVQTLRFSTAKKGIIKAQAAADTGNRLGPLACMK